MTDIHIERAQLVQAVRHITTGKRLIARMEALINEIRSWGHDSTSADATLESLRDVQVSFDVHRQLVLDAIADYGATLGESPPSAPVAEPNH